MDDDRNAAVSIAWLAALRVLFGMLACVSMLRLMVLGWVEPLYSPAGMHFSYWGCAWVQPLPAAAASALCCLLALLGAAIALGLYTRLTSFGFALGFAYLQLGDATNYLNHCYLVLLLALLLGAAPAGRAWSLDVALGRTQRASHVPALWLYLFRFQIAVVYLFAALAKLDADWLVHGQPLRLWLAARSSLPVIGGVLVRPWTAVVLSWAGLLFDATIPWLLMARRTRAYAYAAVVVFHGLTALLFPIGIFPWLMLIGSLVFLPPSWPYALVRARCRGGMAVAGPGLHALALLYAGLQLALPLRGFVYGGDVSWHEQGMRYAWRVMAREKHGFTRYHVHSARLARDWEVAPDRYLNARQAREHAGQPELILQLAHHIAEDFAARGLGPVEVRVTALASLNGRASAPLIDPDVDLARVHDSLRTASWILPAPD